MGDKHRYIISYNYSHRYFIYITGLKSSEGRQETAHNCVCMHGYLQPQPFIERVYLQLIESDDGFVDRLLVCFPKTHILLEEVNINNHYIVLIN